MNGRSVSMLMTQYFVLLQLPHAGGESIRAACLEQMPREAFIPNDLPPVTSYAEIAEDFADLPMLAVVRNPWDWYVAWYHRAMSAGLPAPNIWASALDSGRADFRTALLRACTGIGFESTTTAAAMKADDVDHYSALCTRVVGDGARTGRVEVVRYEQLAEDFERFASAQGIPGAERLAEALREQLAGTDQIDYRPHYDTELRDLVATRARRLIETHEYEF